MLSVAHSNRRRFVGVQGLANQHKSLRDLAFDLVHRLSPKLRDRCKVEAIDAVQTEYRPHVLGQTIDDRPLPRFG